MGLTLGDLSQFFQTEDATGRVLAQRSVLLDDVTQRSKYVALPTAADAAALETIDLAIAMGVSINQDLALLEQMLSLGRSWEPDFVWMHPDSNGIHRLVGGIVCFPSSWSIEEKMGLTMAEIHSPVPGLNAQLGNKIETFLTRLQPGVVWTRENANFTSDSELNHHVEIPVRKLTDDVSIPEFWVRLEHQLLMKLPRSGSVLFGIRVECVSAAEILKDQTARSRLERLFRTISSDAAEYKGIAVAREKLVSLFGADATAAEAPRQS